MTGVDTLKRKHLDKIRNLYKILVEMDLIVQEESP